MNPYVSQQVLTMVTQYSLSKEYAQKRNIFFSQTGAATSLLPPPAHPPFFSISTLIFSTSHSCWFCKVPASQTKITNPPNILYPKKPKPKPQPHNPNTEKSGNLHQWLHASTPQWCLSWVVKTLIWDLSFGLGIVLIQNQRWLID